jgi:L-amino acid N-acyltransferase YncA
MEIIKLSHDHWSDVKRIYEEGIRTGNSTFETEAPSWEYWDKKHHNTLRFVCLVDGNPAGWAALIPTSTRKVYEGVMEVTIYIGEKFRGRGVGKALLDHLIKESEKKNVWSLLSVLFPENTASIKLHEKAGFRVVGIREKMGEMGNKWRDNIMMERRSKKVGYNSSDNKQLIIETERLMLRVLDATNAVPVLEYLQRNQAFFKEWAPPYPDDYFKGQYIKKFLDSWYWNFLDNKGIRLYYSLKNDPEKIIGDISLSEIIYGPFCSCFLSYMQDENESGKGYASEVVSAVIKYAFDELKLHRIEANIMPRNSKSLKLVERLGFKNEGLAEKYLNINGKWEDHLHYVLLNPEM